jgi:hypothetical protein
MSYETLAERIRLLPEDCLDEISNYVEFIIFRRKSQKDKMKDVDLKMFFGSVKSLPDGLKLQRSMRDEWD